jgi:hypothetical protein
VIPLDDVSAIVTARSVPEKLLAHIASAALRFIAPGVFDSTRSSTLFF